MMMRNPGPLPSLEAHLPLSILVKIFQNKVILISFMCIVLVFVLLLFFVFIGCLFNRGGHHYLQIGRMLDIDLISETPPPPVPPSDECIQSVGICDQKGQEAIHS